MVRPMSLALTLLLATLGHLLIATSLKLRLLPLLRSVRRLILRVLQAHPLETLVVWAGVLLLAMIFAPLLTEFLTNVKLRESKPTTSKP